MLASLLRRVPRALSTRPAALSTVPAVLTLALDAGVGLGGSIAVPSGALAATPAPVPCSAISGGRYDCQFYPAGDGISGGAPVQATDSSTVGFLNQGTNWVVCQRTGGTVTSGPYQNNWWAWTEANDGRWGWVNAVWAQGGDNFGRYGGVPACDNSIGLPPGAQPAPAAGSTGVSSSSGGGSSSGGSGSSTGTGSAAGGSGSSTGGGSSSGGGHPGAGGSSGDLRRQRVRIAVHWSQVDAITRVTRLVFGHLPRSARITARCRGSHCRFRTAPVTARALRRRLVRQAFSSGEVLRLRITAPGYRPLVAELHFRARRGPLGRLVSS